MIPGCVYFESEICECYYALFMTDRRRGVCYLHHSGRPGPCTGEFASDVTRATCCCTVGRGWAQRKPSCEMCPRNNTRLFVLLTFSVGRTQTYS
jgi:TB domain